MENTNNLERKFPFFLCKEFIVFVNSLIFTLAFNLPIIVNRFHNYQIAGDDKALYLAIFEIFMSIMFVFPVIYTFSGKRMIWKVILIFIYVVSGLAAYFIYTLGLTINYEIIASFFEASQSEALHFLNVKMFMCLIFSAMLGFLCIYTLKYGRIEEDKNKRIMMMTIVFSLGCTFGDSDWASNIMPHNLIKDSGIYFLEKTALVKKRLNIAKVYKHSFNKEEDDLNVVLIIGESARRDHFSLSGYKRETSPYMKEEKNLIYYEDVTACYPLTRVAVPCMLTRATRDNRKASAAETSFIGVFKEVGFYTTWLGMQGTYSILDAPYFDLAKESNKSMLIGVDVAVFSSNDSNLLPFVDQFFAEHKEGNNLLVLHTYGSHFHYEDRYPEEFRKYTPTCFKKHFLTEMTHCTVEEVYNSYDNSILYTDYFIKNVIDRVRDKNALVIYTPDHAESFGENGRYLHGTHNADEQIAVNMLVWASDKYMELHPEYIANLRNYQKDSISHDYLFHTMLGCSGIKSEVIDKNLNLCAEK